MNRIATFMLLDFRVQLIYRMFPLFFLYSIMLAVFDDSPKSMSFTMILGWIGLLMMSGPACASSEKTRIETLYATLPLTRGDIVKARYLWFICTLVIMLLPLLLKLIFYPNNKMTYFIIACIFLWASFYVAIMYPLYFKFGNKKVSIVIIFLPMVIAFIFSFITHSRWFEFRVLRSRLIPNTPAAMAMTVVVAAGLIFLYLSYLLSCRLYRTRDL